MPEMMSASAPVILRCRSWAAATGTSGSAWPWMMRVGARMLPSSAERSPSAATATSCRAVPSGRQARRTMASSRWRWRTGSGRYSGLPMICSSRSRCATTSGTARLLARLISACCTGSRACGNWRAPEVVMIKVRLLTRSG